MFATDQAAVREKVADCWKAPDVVDFVQHRHGDDPSDAGDRLQPKEVVGVVDLGRLFEILFQLANPACRSDRSMSDVGFDREAYRRIGEDFGDAVAVAGVLQFLCRRQVVLMMGVGDVGQRLAAAADEVGSSSQQVAGRSPVLRDKRRRRRSFHRAAGTPVSRESILSFLTLPPWIALRYSAWPSTNGICSAFAQIAQPVPVESRFAADDEVLAVNGSSLLQKRVGVAGVKVLMQSFFTTRDRRRRRTSCLRAGRFRSRIGVVVDTDSSLVLLG